jgi:hypothetical protein
MVRSRVRKKFFTSCCVSVLPPCSSAPLLTLTHIARAMPFGETPWCESKFWSSTAISVRISNGGTSDTRTRMRSSLCAG